MGPLPRGRRCRVRAPRIRGARDAGRSGTGGLESRAAGPAVPRLSRAQRLRRRCRRQRRRFRRQRRGPGSVRLAVGRGHRGAGHIAGRVGDGPGGPLAGRVTLGVLGGSALSAGGRRRLVGPQEPSRGRRRAGPGIVVSGWLAAGGLIGGLLCGGWLFGGRLFGGRIRGLLCSRLRGGPGFRGVIGRWLARTRNHQARRHGPGGHEIFRIVPAEQACMLPLFLRRETWITIPTRLVTLCIHHRPQSRHISGKCRSVPILTLSRPSGITRGSMLPNESERVQRAIFRRFLGYARPTSRPGWRRAVSWAWMRPYPMAWAVVSVRPRRASSRI